MNQTKVWELCVTRTCAEQSEVAPLSITSVLIMLGSQYPVLLLASPSAEVKFALPRIVLVRLACSRTASPLFLTRHAGDLCPDPPQ
jgi:hypothetical protein